ncbi:MAG TPA: hypothetical protein VGA04_18705 [Streptosporangiaceae bacterium]
MNGQPKPPAEPVAAPAALAGMSVVTDPEIVRIFHEEVRSAVSYEKGLAVKALIALALVGIVVAMRMLFLG